jgi:hypothetical protein
MEKKINVPLHDKPDFVCPNCAGIGGTHLSKHFAKVFRVKVIPALIAGNPEPVIVPIEVLACVVCDYDFTPEDVKTFLNPLPKLGLT